MRALLIAFSIYSSIPVPQFVWDDGDRRNAMFYFPLVGAAVGLVFYAAGWALFRLGMGMAFRGAALAAVPVLMTGGIHMDGFLDTCDARASWGDREKKLEILKDTHAGAYAVIGGVLYFLLAAAAYGELNLTGIGIVSVGFILSRSLSGFAIALLPNARGSGMLADISENMKRTAVCAAMLLTAAAAVAGMAVIQPAMGLFAALTAAATWFYYRRVSMREFGGVTGDLAGWFLQVCELSVAVVLAALASVWR